jgi:hypothetical protein
VLPTGGAKITGREFLGNVCEERETDRGPIRTGMGWMFEGEEYGLIDHSTDEPLATWMNTGGTDWATHMWVYITDTTTTQTFFCRENLEALDG